MKKKVVIIGGGLGGMSAAIRLTTDNYDVTILEKGERLGGKLNKCGGKGYSFDTGPSILTMPWVLEQLFQNANRKTSDYFTIKRIEPQWKTFFEDGSTIELTSDLAELLRQLEAVSKEDASELFNYLSYCSKMYENSLKSVYKKSLSGIQDLRSMHSVKELLSLDLLKTMNQGTKKFFKDKKIQQLFNFLSMNVGSSPYAAPAVLSQLVHVQLGLGIYYVEGGMYKIADSMSRLLHELQVNVHLNTNVKKIITNGSKATGVEIENGRMIDADIVISNLEAIPTYNTLLKDHSLPPYAKQELEKFPPTTSGLILLLGVKKTYENLAHHNFFFSSSPEKEFDQIFNKGKISEDPTIYVGISSKSDSTQAPKGKENLFVLTHVPALKKGETWVNKKHAYTEVILDKLERMGMDHLKDNIEFTYTITPNNLEELYGANGGSIYGVTTDRKKNGGFKIPSKSTVLQNLFFVGGSTHPGGGVPMVILSGQLTADLILKQDFKFKREIG
ncbi:phytoene desaturase family protein [Metabacillus litoralis]|uniref:phytoene desaturase family protein n=1 Tax=Metabacillus litoralis TaxID=152268 RepID=UPI001CFD3C55|nr:phytoene desaturase family protein [Metabacillus litoralis]